MQRFCFALALAMTCSAQAGTGDLWFDTNYQMIQIYGCVDTSYEANEYKLLIAMGSCSGDCTSFVSGNYNDAGTPFTSHDHPVELQTIGSQTYIVLHGKKPSGPAESGAWLLASIKFDDPMGHATRDIYFRNAGGHRSDFKSGSTWRYVTQHMGTTQFGTTEPAAAMTCSGFDQSIYVFWFMDPCGKLYYMEHPTSAILPQPWTRNCCAPLGGLVSVQVRVHRPAWLLARPVPTILGTKFKQTVHQDKVAATVKPFS